MKKVFLFALTCSLLSCSKSEKGNLNISGEIKGLKQGTVYIQTAKDSTIITLDSIVFDGKSNFKTQLNIDEPQVLYLSLNRGTTLSQDNDLLFFAEPGNMVINTTLAHFYGDAKIEGSENQKLLDSYNLSKRTLLNFQNDLIKDLTLYSKAGNQKKADSLEFLLHKSTVRLYLNAVNFALKHTDKEIAPYITLTEILPVSTKYVDSIQNSLSKDVSKSLYGKALIEVNQ